MNQKDILKLAGVKNEKELYAKFKTHEEFLAKYGTQIQKAKGGLSVATEMMANNPEFTNSAFGKLDNTTFSTIPAQDSNVPNWNNTMPNLGGGSGGKKKNPFDLKTFGGFNPGMEIGKGIMNIIEEGKKRKKAEQWANVSDVVAQAASLKPEEQERKYVRPEDVVNTGEEFFPIYGVGTNVLREGGEIQNTYTPNNLYSDLGYEPLNESNKQYYTGGKIKKAQGGLEQILNAGGADVLTKGTDMAFQDNEGYKLGKTVGGAVKMIPGVGPIISAVAEPVLGTIGGLLDPNQKKIRNANDHIEDNMSRIGMQNNFSGVQQQYSSYMRTGGNIRQNNLSELDEYAFGGDLKVYDGEAEEMSYNPYLGSETVMFKGPSHEDGGMPITYGNSPVEVEGGEPAVKMNNGGEQESLVVYGNLQIPKNMLQDKNANGKKFKNYIADLSKIESKQNKIMDKSLKELDETEPVTSFDKLKLTSLKAMMTGADMKLKEIAEKKQDAASLQNAINETAEEHGIVADDLAKGKIKKAKNGLKIAQTGVTEPYLSEYEEWQINQYNLNPITPIKPRGVFQSESTISPRNIPTGKPFEDINTKKISAPYTSEIVRYTPQMPYIEDPFLDMLNQEIITKDEPTGQPKENNKFPWMKAINSVVPYLRPSDVESLDPRQLAGEMYSMSNNQLEPVYAQTIQPDLATPYNISYQDVLNENQADFRSTQKMLANNPAALAVLNAQKYGANQKVKGEEFRQNQAQQQGVYNKNRDLVTQTKLQNLGILDKQQERQAQAKSNTKAIGQKAIESISNKYLQNQLENRTLKTYENLYNYRYDDKGRAINMNAPAEFNTSGSGGRGNKELLPIGYEYIYNKDGQPIDIRKSTTKITSAKEKRNGAIVKAFK